MDAGIVELCEYNRWATRTLIEACASLDPATLEVQPPGTSGTIGALLTHLVGGQQTFVLRTTGRQHESELSRESPFPGFAELLRAAEESSTRLIEVARSAAEDAWVDLPYAGKAFRFPLRFFLLHAVEHGVEHRTELKVGLNQLGIETPDLDGWSYAAFRGYGEEL